MTTLSDQDWHIVWLIAFVGLAVVAIKYYWRWRLGRWAASEGFRLVDFHGAHAFEWPGGGLPNYHETIFRIEVRDSAGHRRTGWLKFGTPLLGMPLKDEHWN